jgi:hypothetical protein
MHVQRLCAAGLVALALFGGAAHAATINVIQPTRANFGGWGIGMEIGPNSTGYLPLMVGSIEVWKSGGSWDPVPRVLPVPESWFGTFTSRLWEDTNPDLNAWSLGKLYADHLTGVGSVGPSPLIPPGHQMVFELVNWNKDFGLIGHMGFVAPSLATPVPAAAWLFGTALLAMLGITRRRPAAA